MMHRETLQTLKRAARKMDHHPSTQTEHALIDHGLQALDLIDGGTTADNRIAEVRKGLDEVRQLIISGQYTAQRYYRGIKALEKAVFALDLISREMLSPDYRRYSTWADTRQQVEEEFGE